jgi:hypothetical protein
MFRRHQQLLERAKETLTSHNLEQFKKLLTLREELIKQYDDMLIRNEAALLDILFGSNDASS